jgi:hypothetical protein
LHPAAERVQEALQLGWSFVEVNGLLKRMQYWGEEKSLARRVFLSHPKPNYGEAVWLALQRLLVLGARIFPATEKSPSVCPPPDTLVRFLADIEGKLGPEGDGHPLSTERIDEIFLALDSWSRACWVHLGAESPVLAEATSLGGSLGDTYWLMKRPGPHTDRVKQETWQYLLGPDRLHHLIEDVRAIEDDLPGAYGPLLRHALWEWGIADDLARDDEGHLQIAHPLAWKRLHKCHTRAVQEMQEAEEKDLLKNLRQQYKLWKALIWGRAVLLTPRDRRQVRWWAGGVYILSVVVLFTLTLLVGWGMFWLAYTLGSGLLQLIDIPKDAEVWLEIGGAVVVVLTFVVTQLWRWGRAIIGLYDGIYAWWRVVKQKQRSLHRWDGQPKAAWLIALQQLVYPKAR